MKLETFLKKIRENSGVKEVVSETKANEVMNTANTGYGKEVIPLEVFKSEIIDIVPERARLLSMLPGNHGSNLPKKYTAGARGVSNGDLLFSGKTEWSTGYAYQTQDDHTIQKAKTMQVSLEQQSFITEINISDEELRYNAVDLEQYIKERLADGMAFTIDSIIINGDTTTASTGNVNSDDGAPTAGTYYLKANGLRYYANAGSYTKNVGTLAAADYADLLSVMGEYAERPEDCLFIQNSKTTNKMIQIDSFMTVANSGDRATIQKGIRPTPFGVEVLTHRAVPNAEADGKVSTTAGNNTLGVIVAMYKPAVQYGFGQDFNLEVVRVAGYGYRLVATFDFAFSIVDAGTSLSNPTVACGINVTIA